MIAAETAAREVARGRGSKRSARGNVFTVPPIHFRDERWGHAEMCKRSAHTQRGIHRFYAVAQPADGARIQVIVMVMGDDEDINIRKVFYTVHIAARERLHGKRNRGSMAAENGIYQDVQAPVLDQV